ncbi:hypothetical protein D1AOALGA4SA_7442 [Olavius algarvensis Delta 1 endosymbiont]|nr:hypothetical protein D1AOALGA4SA_7442 [Olavius algarvensis Delta 1 endosymbiont]
MKLIRNSQINLVHWIVVNRRFNRLSFSNPPVIPAKAGIQQNRSVFWIPALRSAAAGLT